MLASSFSRLSFSFFLFESVLYQWTRPSSIVMSVLLVVKLIGMVLRTFKKHRDMCGFCPAPALSDFQHVIPMLDFEPLATLPLLNRPISESTLKSSSQTILRQDRYKNVIQMFNSKPWNIRYIKTKNQ